ncbi:hypothetical protein EC973_006191 [Apophysomyces ossiformis]|uniref:Uncharacterized protein n=1 Tax=Apophysomyces ossiformis TaxID=679940 RepID=A0A8H7BRE9_9FUNG|nr:hypothetical protein EC973_006191 [Apophysomyces ossiformis]
MIDLIPPFRYALVEENIFRGGYPKPRNMRFLKSLLSIVLPFRLRLKTILSLIPEKLIPEMQEFCQQQNINMVHLTVDKMKEDNIPLSYNKTLMALQIIIDPANHPLYLHCLDGADVTGLVVACLRKLQMWSTSSAMSEFSRHLHTNVIASEEFEFIENFKNFEIIIPSVLPKWLWGGQVYFRKHSCLRLKFLNPEMMTEEERELKDLKERKEKEKEDYYKKRKNDLLDNLFDASTATSHGTLRNRSVSHFSVGSGSGSLSQPATTASSSHKTSSVASADEASFVPSPQVSIEQSVVSSTSGRQNLQDAHQEEDQYLVDVDVDVDGVMIDGLDQVEFGRSSRFYRGEDGHDDDHIFEEMDHDDYDEGKARFLDEPISRTLEALALEGLHG